MYLGTGNSLLPGPQTCPPVQAPGPSQGTSTRCSGTGLAEMWRANPAHLQCEHRPRGPEGGPLPASPDGTEQQFISRFPESGVVPGAGSGRLEGRDPGEAAAIGISFAPNLEVPAEHAGEAKTPGSLGGCCSGGRKGLMSGSGRHTWCRPYDALSHLDSFSVHIGFVS